MTHFIWLIRSKIEQRIPDMNLKNFFSDLQNLKFEIFEVKDLFSLTLKLTKTKWRHQYVTFLTNWRHRYRIYRNATVKNRSKITDSRKYAIFKNQRNFGPKISKIKSDLKKSTLWKIFWKQPIQVTFSMF